MGDYVLPAAPNWYCSRVSACTTSGHFLYGAKNNVFIFNVIKRPSSYVGRFYCHSERVVGLSVHASDVGRAVTAGEDGRVRLWNYSALLHHETGGDVPAPKPEAVMVDEHANHKNKCTAVHWSSKDDNTVVSGDDRGVLIVWHLTQGDVRQMQHEKASVVCLECSPHNRYHLAVGYRNGMIHIVDISQQGAILARLRGHDDEIHTVTWCPFPGEDVRQRAEGEEECTEAASSAAAYVPGCLLASGSRDKTLRVWSTARGRCLLNFKVTPSSGRRDKYEDQKTRVWLAIKWADDNQRQLYTSNQSGDLLLWDLCRPGKQKYEVITPRGSPKVGHHRIVFNISSPGGAMSNVLVTISMDRQIIVWNINELSTESIQTLGGFAYCIAQSSINPTCLAVGVGDNMIRVWNTSNPNTPYDCLTYWQGLKSKVTALSWHPEKEGFLAFGTDDGRVGVYDVAALNNRPPKISCTFHKKTVYVVTWGPPCSGTGTDASHVVYSCGDGNVLLHDFSQPSEDAININEALSHTKKQGRAGLKTEISWKEDHSAVAIGNEDGCIDVYRMPGFQHIAVLQVHRKLVNVIRWHPVYVGDDVTASPCQHWLATGSNESSIQVFNLEALIDGPAPSSAPIITESYISLDGHSHRITGLAWSCHSNGLLASASYDGSSQVWRLLPSIEAVANYRGHQGRLLAVAWSAQDQDVVYTGGDDFCVLSWRVSAQAHKTPPQGTDKKRKPKSKNRSKTAPAETDTKVKAVVDDVIEINVINGSHDDVTMDEIQRMMDARRQELLQSITDTGATLVSSGQSVSPSGSANPMEAADMARRGDKITEVTDIDASTGMEPAPVKREIKDSKKRRVKSMLPVFCNAENRRKMVLQEECVTLAKHLAGSEEGGYGEGLRHLGMYSKRRDMYRLVEEEASNHRHQGNQEQLVTLDIWSCDLADTLKRAAQSGSLNDTLMAHAASVSPAVWRSMCEQYAAQLECDGHMTKAASFLLSAGDVYQAVELFTRHHMYKEAVTMCRLRLSLQDPVVEELYVQWAQHLTADNSYEQAAKCYLAVGRHLDAAHCLARRYDVTALKAALDITHLANEREAYKAYAHKYIHECQLAGDWQLALDFIRADQDYKVRLLPVLTHQVLVHQMSAMDLYDAHDLSAANSSLIPQQANACIRTQNLPKLLLDPGDADPLCPWTPHLVEDEATILYLLRVWLNQGDLHLDTTSLNATYQQLHELRGANQRHTQVKQSLLTASLDVSLGLVCLLLANTKMAAYWWVRALVACQDTNSQPLIQGLCRLLLPQGRNSLLLLQQQVLAFKTVMLADVTVASPTLDVSKLRLPATPTIVISQTETNKNNPVINNSSLKCSSIDSLGAIYCLTAINHWLQHSKEQNQTRTANSAHQSQTETETSSQQNQTKTCEATPEATPEDSPTGDHVDNNGNENRQSEESQAPNLEVVVGLCQGTLWDIQMKRNRLLAILSEIEKVAAEKSAQRLTASKAGETKGAAVGGTAAGTGGETAVPPHLLSCSTLPLARTLSGEYIHMLAPSSNQLNSDTDTVDICGEPVSVSPSTVSVSAATESVSAATESVSAATVSVSPVTESVSAVTECGDGCEYESMVDDESTYVAVSGGGSSTSLLDLGGAWAGLVDGKYTGQDTTITSLCTDKEAVTAELTRMSAYVTGTPFTDPMVTCGLLLKLLPHVPQGAVLLAAIRRWGRDHAFTVDQLALFQ